MKIADVTSIQQINPQDKTGVSNRSIDPVSGMESLAGTLDQMATKQVDFQEQSAKADFLKASTELHDQFKQDPGDYTTLTQRYQQALNDKAQQAASSIGSASRRQQFMQNAQVDIENNASRMNDYAFSLERDDGRAKVDSQLDGLRETYLNSQDPEKAIGQVDNLVNSAVQAGYYSHEEAQQLTDKWRQSAAIGKIQMMDPRDQISAINQPWAKNIPADKRAIILKSARALRAKDQGLTVAIDVGSKFNGDINAQENYLNKQYSDGKITSDVHDIALQKIRSDYAQQQSVQRQQDHQVLGDIWNLKQQNPGATVGDIPKDQYSYIVNRGLGPEAQKIMSSDGTSDDPMLYMSLMTKASSDPKGFMNDMMDPRIGVADLSRLSKSHRDKIEQAYISLQNNDQQGIDAVKLAHQTVSDIRSQLVAAGLAPNPKDTTDAQNLANFESNLHDQIMALPPTMTPAQKREQARAIGLSMLKQQSVKGMLWDTTEYPYQMDSEDRQKDWNIPDGVKSQVVQQLKDTGYKNPSDSDVQNAYKVSQGVIPDALHQQIVQQIESDGRMQPTPGNVMKYARIMYGITQ